VEQAAQVSNPPGPRLSPLARFLYLPARDPLRFFTAMAQAYGDIAYTRVGGERLYLLGNPRDIRDVLVTRQHLFAKGRGLERAKRLLGQGLVTSEGELHRRQRRLIQPAFHRDRIASYATVMTDYADRVQREWIDGQAIDVAQEMMRLTLGVVGKTLFDADVESQAPAVGRALTAVMESFWFAMLLPFGDLVERLPLPPLRRSRKARLELDRIIYRMIAERREALRDRGDLLSMLLLAQDEESDRGMSDRQVRDEAMTIFLAGHETTANALSWTFYLLSGEPAAEARLREEIDRVVGGRVPAFADLGSLGYVERVVTEAMRLYPPAWIIGRRALQDYEVGGYRVPAGSLVLMSPYIVHRDPRHYPDPDRFLPDRWTPQFRESLPPFAYLPFGGGARRCIGESFAWMELVLVLTTIARRWRLQLVPGHPVVPRPVVTLRPKYGLKMTAHQV
jgi:cytochrome P450